MGGGRFEAGGGRCGCGVGGGRARSEGGIDGELYEWVVHLDVTADPHAGLFNHCAAQDMLRYVYWESS